MCRPLGPQPNVAIRGSSGGCAKEPSCRGHRGKLLGWGGAMPGGLHGQSPAGQKGPRQWERLCRLFACREAVQKEGSCRVVLAPVPGYPSLAETHGEGGRSLHAHRMHALDWGHRTKGDTIATRGTLGWMLSFVMFGAVSVDPERRCHMRVPGAYGWEGHEPMSCAVASQLCHVSRGLGCGSM